MRRFVPAIVVFLFNVGLQVIGIQSLALGLFLWGLAVALAIWAAVTSSKVREFCGRLVVRLAGGHVSGRQRELGLRDFLVIVRRAPGEMLPLLDVIGTEINALGNCAEEYRLRIDGEKSSEHPNADRIDDWVRRTALEAKKSFGKIGRVSDKLDDLFAALMKSFDGLARHATFHGMKAADLSDLRSMVAGTMAGTSAATASLSRYRAIVEWLRGHPDGEPGISADFTEACDDGLVVVDRLVGIFENARDSSQAVLSKLDKVQPTAAGTPS